MTQKPIAIAPNCEQEQEPDLLPVADARARILQAVQPLRAVVHAATRSGLHRVLGQDIRSTVNVPSSTNSAVDGYALHSASLPAEGSAWLPVVGRALAGHLHQNAVPRGACVQITTGAALPPDTDTVVMLEHTEAHEQQVRIGSGHRPGQNVRQAGEDLAQGQIALRAGTRLRPAEIGLLASLGLAEVPLYRKPRVAFFSTGDELRQVGQPVGAGEIYDSNRYTLYALLERLGAEIIDYGVVADSPQALRSVLSHAAADADAIVTSGGVSVGEADFIKQVLAELGQVDFWKIAMKPGRPFAFGRIGESLFFGLPGNPVAVMVTFYQFVQPALHRLAGGHGDGLAPCFTVRSAQPLRKKPGRTEYLRGILERGDDQQLQVRTTGPQGSGILRSMCEADCLVILPHDGGTVRPGDPVLVQPFTGLV